MKQLILLSATLAVMGLSCTFPQRTKTFLPPTNERDLCQWDDRFFYSTVYDYCFRYPDGWTNVTNTGPRTLTGSSVTVNTFSMPVNGVIAPIFDLYGTAYGEQNREEMGQLGVTIAYDADPYIFGYNVLEPTYAKEVQQMLQNIEVFAQPQGRQ